MDDVMLDLETLGTAPGSVIRTVGAVRFDPFTGQTGPSLHLAISREDMMCLGFRVSTDTERFWARPQNRDADRAIRAMEQLAVIDALERVEAFLRSPNYGEPVIWAQGANFDPVLLESAYRGLRRKAPWGYSAVRDTRTVYALAHGRPASPVRREGVHHTALDDCLHQVRCVHAALCVLMPGAVRAHS